MYLDTLTLEKVAPTAKRKRRQILLYHIINITRYFTICDKINLAIELSNLFVIVSEQLLEFNLALMNYCVKIKYVSLIPYETFVLISSH